MTGEWDDIAHALAFALAKLVEEGDTCEIPDCPGDDTCVCLTAKAVNTSLHAYFQKSGVPPHEMRGISLEDFLSRVAEHDRTPRS